MPIIVIHNVETDEVIEREMNAEELKQYEADQAEIAAKKTAQKIVDEKKAEAEAKLAALGLNADDLKALGLG